MRGGGVGGLGNAIIKSIEPSINYTVLDPDSNCIKYGKRHFPHFKFIEGYFPDKCPRKKFDMIIMFATFPQLPNWKEILLEMVKHSKKYINLTLTVRLSGTTVVDKDVSYFYYLDSRQRVHQVIHNLYELINFCSIHEMRAKRIIFYGYHVPQNGNNNRCVPNKEQIRGNLFLELFPDNKQYPGRVGGAPEGFFKEINVPFFTPSIEIIIDGKPFNIN